MHEAAIVETLIRQVEARVAAAGRPGRVARLELAVGWLAGVHPDALRLAFDVLAAGTSLEGAAMDITRTTASCRCAACQAVSEIDEWTPACPRCGSPQVTIDGGTDLVLKTIELESSENHPRGSKA